MNNNASQGVGAKYDGGKARFSLLPWDSLRAVVEVLEFGAKKYSAHSWRGVPNGYQRYFDALLRHVAALQQGEYRDAESGLPHLWHVGCNSLFLIALDPARVSEVGNALQSPLKCAESTAGVGRTGPDASVKCPESGIDAGA